MKKIVFVSGFLCKIEGTYNADVLYLESNILPILKDQPL